MKLHVNLPDYEKGFELTVMHIGPVKNGDTVELSEVQLANLEAAGITIPESGDLYLVPPRQEQAEPEELQTTDLPSIAEIAEQERVKTSKVGERTVEDILAEVGDDPVKAEAALRTEGSRGPKARVTLIDKLNAVISAGGNK